METFWGWLGIGAMVAVALILHLYGWGLLVGWVSNWTDQPVAKVLAHVLGALAGVAVTCLFVVFLVAYLSWKYVLRHIFWLGKTLWEIGRESAP